MKNKLKNKRVRKCLLCSQKKLKKIFYLGNFYVSNFVTKKNIKKGNIKCPLNLLYCNMFFDTTFPYCSSRIDVQKILLV